MALPKNLGDLFLNTLDVMGGRVLPREPAGLHATLDQKPKPEDAATRSPAWGDEQLYFQRPTPERRDQRQSPGVQALCSLLWVGFSVACGIGPAYPNLAEMQRMYLLFRRPAFALRPTYFAVFWIGLFLTHALAAVFVWNIPAVAQKPRTTLPLCYVLVLLMLLPDVLFGYLWIPGAVILNVLAILVLVYLLFRLRATSLPASCLLVVLLGELAYLLAVLSALQHYNPKHPADNGSGLHLALFP